MGLVTAPRKKPITVKVPKEVVLEGKISVEIERKQFDKDSTQDDVFNFHGGFAKFLQYHNKCLDRDASNNARNTGNSQPDGTALEVIVTKTQESAKNWTPTLRSGLTQKEKAEQAEVTLGFLEALAKGDIAAASPEEMKAQIQKFLDEQLAAAL